MAEASKKLVDLPTVAGLGTTVIPRPAARHGHDKLAFRAVRVSGVSRGAAVYRQRDCFESAVALVPTLRPSHHTLA